MANFDAKTWFRGNVAKYLIAIKAWVTAQISTAKEELRAEFGSITGVFKGSVALFAELAAITAKNGDWAVLKADDGTNESGIYVKSSTGWSYVADITTIDEVQTILASDAEFAAGTLTNKTATVKQIAEALALKAQKVGDAGQSFAVADAKEGTKEAVNASQFTSVTQAEANADWAAA
jgi:hypothetical protein